MAAAVELVTGRDDRVLPLTRGVSLAIIPFLVVAFVVLYPWPHDTGRLFAWEIRPTLTAMILGSVYLGGFGFGEGGALLWEQQGARPSPLHARGGL